MKKSKQRVGGEREKIPGDQPCTLSTPQGKIYSILPPCRYCPQFCSSLAHCSYPRASLILAIVHQMVQLLPAARSALWGGMGGGVCFGELCTMHASSASLLLENYSVWQNPLL